MGYNTCCMGENISAEKSARLEELLKQRFTREGKAERVAKAIAALYQGGAYQALSCRMEMGRRRR